MGVESRGRPLSTVAAAAAGYALLGLLTIKLLFAAGFAMPLWPSAGFALAMTLRRGVATLSGIVLGSLAVNLTIWIGLHGAAEPSVIFRFALVGCGAAAQAQVGALLVRRFTEGDDHLLDWQDILTFLVLGGGVACLVSASVAVFALPPEPGFSGEAANRWLLWWLGDTSGVFLVGPVVLAVLERRRAPWADRRLSVGIALLAAVLLLGGVLRLAIDSADRRLRQDLFELARAQHSQFEVSLAHAEQLISSAAAFVEQTGPLSEDAFRSFVARPLADNAALAAISWNPRILHAERAAFEEALGQELRVIAGRGGLHTAPPRPEYVAVEFIEPRRGNLAALGLDVAAEPRRAAALEAASRTGEVASTEAIQLAQSAPGELAVLLFAPVGGSDGSPRGFVVGVFQMGPLLDVPLERAGLVFGARLTDLSAETPQEIGSVRSEQVQWDVPDVVWQNVLTVGGRIWQLELAVTHHQMGRRRAFLESGALIASMLLAGLLSALILLLAGRSERDRQQLEALADVNLALKLEVEERQRAEESARRIAEEAEHLAAHDPLTGLANRREFERLADRLTEHARRNDAEHALAFIDLDQFKLVNDTVGHAAGDQLLKQAAALLQEHTRVGDTLARLGGDEFGLLLPRCGLAKARETAQRLVRSLEGHRFVWNGRPFAIGASIGVVRISQASAGTGELLAQADVACYAAKEAGRGRVHVYEGEDESARDRHAEILTASALRDAIDRGRLRLVRQPIVALGEREEARQFEVLVRMIGPDGAEVLPGQFIPAAERYGLIRDLDRWVVRRALQALATWPQGERVAINLSGPSLADPAMREFVIAELAESGLDPRRVGFEITETAAIGNLAAAQQFVADVGAIGCTLALDDFGSGMSSFAYLKNLKVDSVKIDAFFVRELEDPTHAIMVRAINDLAHALGIQTVAEGAETEAVVALLRELGVDRAQGWVLGRPAPLPDPVSPATS